MATTYQHLLHWCHFDVTGVPIVQTATGACGVERPMFPIPTDDPRCPDCIELIGTTTACPACGQTGWLAEVP